MTSAPVPPTQGKRGPKTPEGKARSAMNAVRHGLRARTFALLPEESPAEWATHLEDLRRCYGPVDETEEKLVAAIAAAMWNEIRADRHMARTMAAIPDGGDLLEPAPARAMATAIRYLTAAGMATQRAQRAFLAHRKAKQAGDLFPGSIRPLHLHDRGPGGCRAIRPAACRHPSSNNSASPVAGSPRAPWVFGASGDSPIGPA